MKTDNEIIPVEVYSGTILEAQMVKSLLENADIEVFLKDEIIGTLLPFYATPGGMGSVKVIVSNVDYEKSVSIIEEFKKNNENE